MSDSITNLAQLLRSFARERDWEKFHSPKNLAMALSVEAGELMEHFQWLTEEQSQNLSKTKCDEVRQEMADIFLYLVRIADTLEIDLMEAAMEKIAINQDRYPAAKVKGSARKYTEYPE